MTLGGEFSIIGRKKQGVVFLESIICLLIFIVISLFMSNFILGISKTLIVNNKVSSDVLKIRELDMFLHSEFDRFAYDFKIVSNDKITYKKILPDSMTLCEVKKRELSFKGNSVYLNYDDKNTKTLLKNVDSFDIYSRDNLIFIKFVFGTQTLTKIIPEVSYSI